MSCQRQCVTHYIFLGVRVQFANTVPACSFFCLETVVVFDQFNVSSRVANTICSRRPALGPACVASGERTRVRSVGSAGYHEAAPCGAGRVERVLRLRSLFRASHNGAVGAYRGAPLGGGGSLPECALRVSVVLPRAGHLVWPSIWGGAWGSLSFASRAAARKSLRLGRLFNGARGSGYGYDPRVLSASGGIRGSQRASLGFAGIPGSGSREVRPKIVRWRSSPATRHLSPVAIPPVEARDGFGPRVRSCDELGLGPSPSRSFSEELVRLRGRYFPVLAASGCHCAVARPFSSR